MKKLKEKPYKESKKALEEIVKKKTILQNRHFKPGNLIFTSYNAKNKDVIFDRTPLFLVLARSNSHTLGLNFHWIPFNMRIWLVSYIIRKNKKNIRDGKPIDFNYQQLKPMLKKLHFAPCIRLYINSRHGVKGAIIPPERLPEVAKLNLASLTGIPTEIVYKRAYDKAHKKLRK